ncbi:hypothetical protein J508_2517 [Acinetobacter sp. 1289694]|nr:hypothetical protein J508_2517 [Acinetobacter sp. 1289694]EXB77707.1 hypothetical protein J551_1589 [Acinetobacter sp. 1475718]KCX97489.1 hypothetical protein J584_1949 [Acinetobacter sp. 72431]
MSMKKINIIYEKMIILIHSPKDKNIEVEHYFILLIFYLLSFFILFSNQKSIIFISNN